MRNYTPIKADSGGGDYAEYLLKKEALKESADYYVEGQAQAIASVYIGSKAKALGLEGEISLEAAQALLDGVLPDGTQIRYEKATGKEILGHDNTFSAPKSASIQCASDMRVFDCHVAAVQSAIAALEDYCCYQRVQVDGHRTHERGSGFVGWMTHHWQSREGDIDLHTHVVTANGCEGPDGQWRSIHDTLMSEARWLGDLYRNCYAQNLQEIGYEIREKKLPKGGYSFEIVGYSEKDVDDFSIRHQQIAEARSRGMSDRAAWSATRKDKDDELSIGELFEQTLDQKAALGVVGHENPTAPNEKPIGKTDAKAAVDLAIAHLARGQCKFTESDLLGQIFTHMEQFGLGEVEAEIAAHPELVDYGAIHDIELKGVYTTAPSLQRETDIINRWMEGQGKATPILDKAASKEAIARLEAIYKSEWESNHEIQVSELRAKIESGDTSKKTAVKLKRLEREEFKPLNKGHLGAIQGVLATEEQHCIIYGLSGVGKTRSLKPLKTILDEEKVETLWLAPSIGASDVLGNDIGQQAFTAQRLAYTDSIKLKKGMVIGIDEAGLIDAECMDLIGIKAKEAGARILLIGDPKQNLPVQAGSPMISLMYNGAEVFNITEILRQQDPIQKRAVELIARGDGVSSIKLLNEHGYVTEIEDPGERQGAIASQYLGLEKPERGKTLVIAGTNAERIAITGLIRDGLKAEGYLGESLDCLQLVDSRLSPEQQTDIRNYAIGQYIDPLQSYAKARRHEFCKIVGKTETHLILQNPRGVEFELLPDRWDKRVYDADNINIAVNDEIRFKGGIHNANYKNGQIFTVTGIEGTIATLANAKGKTQTLDFSKPLPIDHNIVRTTYDVQGSGKDGAILSLTRDRTSNKGSTYVGISRQFNYLSVYTQDYDALLKRVAVECTHDNALDLLELFNYDHSKRGSFEPRNGGITQNYNSPKELAGRSSGSDESNYGRGRGGIKVATEHRQIERNRRGNSQTHEGIGRAERSDDKHLERSITQTRSIDRAVGALAETYLRTERVKNLTPALQQFGATLELLREAEGELRDAIAAKEAAQAAVAEKMAKLTDDRPTPTYKIVSEALAEWRELRKTQPELKAEILIGRALMERTKDSRIEPSPVTKVRRWPEFVRQVPDLNG
jgi:conjugative relaxase-like TrwC/TraI family protein